MTQKKVAAKKGASQGLSVDQSEEMPAGEGEGNVDKIRDILFGTQMKDYERKFQRLEGRLAKDLTRNKDDLNRRIDTLEGYIKKEVVSINDRLKQEKSQRTAALKELGAEQMSNIKAVEKKLTALEDLVGTMAQELRVQILEQSNVLSDDIANKQHESDDALEMVATELREDKLDRTGLSEMFTDLALRLADSDATIL
jgi:hypothetical protein